MAADIEAVRSSLMPYHGKILACIMDGFGEWRDLQAFRASSGLAPNLYSRTNSNEIFDAIIRRAIPMFGAETNVSVKVEAQTAKFIFRGVIARFKKAGDDGLGSNIHTQAAMDFMNADKVFPGLPPETAKIELIWEPNSIWTKVDRVLVVARDGNRLLWEYEIVADVAGGAITPPTPIIPHDPGGDELDASDLIKPKIKPQAKPIEK